MRCFTLTSLAAGNFNHILLHIVTRKCTCNLHSDAVRTREAYKTN